jgi:hypothetical protein
VRLNFAFLDSVFLYYVYTLMYTKFPWALQQSEESSLKNRGKIVQWISLALILCAPVTGIFGAALSLLQTNRTISNAGSVKGIGVGIYWDSACTNRTSSINWGMLDPSSNKTVTVYIRNEGNAAATLSKATQNWNPSTASSYMTLNWNYASQTLNVNQVLQTKLTLVVSPTISGIMNFSFDTTITATG